MWGSKEISIEYVPLNSLILQIKKSRPRKVEGLPVPHCPSVEEPGLDPASWFSAPHCFHPYLLIALSSGLEGSKDPWTSSLNRKQNVLHYLSASSQTRQREEHHSALWKQPAVWCPRTWDTATLNRKLSRGPAGERQVAVVGWRLPPVQRGAHGQGLERGFNSSYFSPSTGLWGSYYRTVSPSLNLPVWMSSEEDVICVGT